MLAVAASYLTPLTPAARPATAERPADTLANVRVAFEPNLGQAGNGIDFVAHHGDAVTAFRGTDATTSLGGTQVTMSLDGAAATSFAGEDALASTTNYFLGNDPGAWRSGVPNFGRLLARNVYPGIDLSYYGTGSALEHDFIVNPGADYHQISVSFTGQDSITQDADGNLLLETGGNELRLNAPRTYQRGEHEQRTVASRFELTGSTATVAVTGTYDRSEPLVIDPALVYSTYLGGTAFEMGRKVVVDSSGAAYVTGNTLSADFPTQAPYQGTYGGVGSGPPFDDERGDAFVAKLNPAGTGFVYATYLGGSGNDYGMGIAVDSSGNAYVAGDTTSTDFPTASPYQGASAGGDHDAFIAKLNASGSALTYSTYIGGSGDDKVRMIALDGSNNAYITGYESSTDYPTLNAYQATQGGGYDGYVTELNAAGTSLVYSTYLGGSDIGFGDSGYDLVVSSAGSAYVVGATTATDFPTTSAYQGTYGGGFSDAFVAKFNPGGSANFVTYLGGSGEEHGRGIDIDSGGNLYVTGLTKSSDFPTQSAFQPISSGDFDAFVTKMDTDGTGLIYSTYLGGSGNDEGIGIAVSAGDEAYVAGYTDSTNLPLVLPYQTTLSGGSDILAFKLNSSGNAMYATYLGGSGVEYALGMDVGPNGRPYLTGYTDSSDLPTTGLQQTFGGAADAFVIQLSDDSFTVTGVAEPILNFTIGSTTCDFGRFSATETKSCSHTMTAATNAANGYVISYVPTSTLTSGANTIDAMASQGASVLASEQLGFNLKANTAAGSFTASNFGANPVGGSGTAKTGYDIADQFKFNVGGDDIAESTVATNSTVYTVSFIANISYVTEPGIYTTPITYTIVPSF